MFWWPFFKKKRVGVVLGGGIARGIAHVGVLKVLHENKIPIDYIVGTSSGSLVAAAYASGVDIELLEQIALRIHWGELIKLTFFKPGFISGDAVANLYNKYVGEKDFSDLKIPFTAVATDFSTGALVKITKGSVGKAVAASACFPGFFSPEKISGKLLVDGGIASNVPVSVARQMGAEFVIASDVVPAKYVMASPKDPLQALGRALDLMLRNGSIEEARTADALIEFEMGDEDIWHLDFHKAKKLISAGEISAHRMINKIKKSLKL
ncbi:MAG: patatin-like phospholipase family protein [Candidatus Margulisiibacteriota bacterium]